MVLFSILVAFTLNVGLALAARCQNITVPVTISARNGVFNIAVPSTNVETTNFILNLNQQGHNFSEVLLTDYATISGTYQLATTYCAPESGKSRAIQILTHGVGFDRSYWHPSINNYNYSYVNTAVDKYGFSTLSWDRLGIGRSYQDTYDPVSVVQAPLEQAALQALTTLIQNGTFPNVRNRFERIIHVGHSFGSLLSYALARDHPNLSDGLVLTAFSQNGTFAPFFSLGANFESVTGISTLATRYKAGYFASGNPSAVQTNFFAPGEFDPAVLAVATETGHPVSMGELLTLSGSAAGVNLFTGPVLIITGERDLPFCGGDCFATGDPDLPDIPSISKQLLPKADPFEVFIVPKAGHGLNLEYSNKLSYEKIHEFLIRKGR